MNTWDYDESRTGLGGPLLALGVALGTAAALLLTTRQGQQLRQQIIEQTGKWTSQAADIIAQGRENMIAAVEQQSSTESGRVKEKS